MMVVYSVDQYADSASGERFFATLAEAKAEVELDNRNDCAVVRRHVVATMPLRDLVIACLNGMGWAAGGGTPVRGPYGDNEHPRRASSAAYARVHPAEDE
jgi:hypothetical protein